MDRTGERLRVAGRQRRYSLWARSKVRGSVGIRLWALPGLGVVLTILLRAAYLNRSFEVFFDDVVYTRISQHVANSLSVTYDGRTPFFLHPPLFFLLQGGYLKLVSLWHPAGDQIATVFEARYLNVMFAALTVLALFLLCRRLVGTLAGLAAMLLFALDPFVIRIDSRNLLEPSAVFWIVLGLWLLARTEEAHGRRLHSVLTGLAFGAALLTNEPAAFDTLFPLAICLALGWVVPRRASLLALCVAAATYAVYPLTVVLAGNWQEFSAQKMRGLLRFLGALQLSGFNAHGHSPTFQSALLTDAGQFATSYALIALGALAAVALLVIGRSRAQRLAGIFAACAYAQQAFAILRGTNEEQYYLYLVVLAILSVVVAFATLVTPWLASRVKPGRRADRRASAVLAALAMLAFTGVAGHQWLVRHLTPDDGYVRLYAQIHRELPPGTKIGFTNLTDSALLQGSGFRATATPNSKAVLDNHDQYVVVTTAQVNRGYSGTDPQLLRWLQLHGKPVFQFQGPTDGSLILYRVNGS